MRAPGVVHSFMSLGFSIDSYVLESALSAVTQLPGFDQVGAVVLQDDEHVLIGLRWVNRIILSLY